MELSIEQKNAQLSLENIRRECLEEGAFLKRIYEDQKRVKVEIKLAYETLEKDRELLNQDTVSLEKERASFADEVAAFRKYELIKKKELEVVREQIHEAMKELSKLNSWVSTAEDRETELTTIVSSLQRQLEAKSELLRDLADIKKQHTAAREELSETRVDSSLVVLSTNETLSSLRAEVKVLEAQRDEVVFEAKEAENQRNLFLDEKVRVSQDLEIYITRIEEKYGEAFPGLRMKL